MRILLTKPVQRIRPRRTKGNGVKPWSCAILALALLAAPAVVWADSSASPGIDISLKLGEDTLQINGQAVTVEKPFVQDGTTLVPVRVITTAFGASVSWDSATQTVGLQFGSHTLKLTIGSTTASVDGKPVELETAPQLTNDTTMVPLRFISENFGAKVDYNADTSTVTIHGQAAAATGGSGIDIDAGKTKIGDSYYGWSIKYPSGLVKQDASFKNNFVTFANADGEYELYVYVKDSNVDKMSKDSLLSELSDSIDTSDTAILSKSTETNETGTYAKLVTKSSAGEYAEHRAFFSNGKLYFVSLFVKKEENYKNPAKAQGYKDLLDSFRLGYDTADRSIKDLSTVKDGLRPFASDDYGFKLKLPADWNKSSANDNHFYFYSDSVTNQSMSVKVTSTGTETLDQWLAREKQDFSSQFAADYQKTSEAASTQVGGQPAKEVTFAYKLSDKWEYDYDLMVIKGSLKFDINFSYPEGASDKEIQDRKMMLLQSFAFTDKTNSSLGKIDDTPTDYNTKVTVKNKAGKFSVTLPEYWSKEEQNGSLAYDFMGGSFVIVSTPETQASKADYVRYFQKKYSDDQQASADFKILESREDTFLGAPAYKFVAEGKDNGGRARITHYIVTLNGMTYNVIYSINLAVATDENMKRLNDAAASIKPLS